MDIELLRQSAFILTTEDGNSIAVDVGYEVCADIIGGLAPCAVLVSHLHPDHFHRPHLDSLDAPVYGPPDVATQLADAPFPVEAIRPGERISIVGMDIEVFASDHGPNISTPIDNLGFAFYGFGKSVLFLGDMAVPSAVPNGPWDVVLVPVGCSKVFSPQEAADFLRTLGHNGLVIPIHYHGRSDPQCGRAFEALALGSSRVVIPAIGERVTL